jgi:uncharacterized protein (TIRG00374 family)
VGYFLGNWRFWAGVLVSVVALGLLVLLVDRRELLEALLSANYLYLAPAIVLYFIGQWFRALRWQFLLAPISAIPARRLYPVIIIGYMANNVLPARLGELVRAVYLAQREEEVSVPTSIATLSVERLYDGLTLLAIGAVAAPILLAAGLFNAASLAYQSTAVVLMIGVIGSFVSALLILTALATSRRAVEWLIAVTGILPTRFRSIAVEVIHGFVEGLATLNSPRKHAILFLGSLPVWLAEAGVYLIVAYSFNLDAWFDSFWLLAAAILLVTVTSNLITAVPASIGGIGPFEVVAQQTLVALGIGAAAAAAYSVAVHLVALWLPVNIAGVLLLLWHNLSLRRLTALPEADVEREPDVVSARVTDGTGAGAMQDG